LVQDLIDDVPKTGDAVSGYSITQIELSVIDQRTADDWKSYLKNNYNNPTENGLDALFARWSY
jgi:hypothetical protein